MNKKLATASLALCLLISGCASGSPGTDAPPQPSVNEETATEPADLTGNWKQSNAMSDDSYQAAVIKVGVITIHWVTNNGDTKSLYWVGSFEAPPDAVQPYAWISKRDKKATDNAIMASGANTEEFAFTENKITDEASIMGTKGIIRLEK